MATPRNGQYRYRLTSIAPEAPADPAPTTRGPRTRDVNFTTATISLYENNFLSDTVTVPVN